MAGLDPSSQHAATCLPIHQKSDLIDVQGDNGHPRYRNPGSIHEIPSQGTTPEGLVAKTCPALHIINLPNEILNHIIQALDSLPPSSQKALSKPEYNLTHSTSTSQPLKSLSLSTKHIRTLVLPFLFRHSQVDPYYISSFLEFVDKVSIAWHISTVTARLQGPCNHIHPAWWSQLLNHLPQLTQLTVLAAPHIFAEIGQVPIETSHSWAFKIPYHTVTLGTTSTVSAPPSSKSSNESPGSTASDSDSARTLLNTHDWTSLSVNESSHLPAYSTYEYFLKVPPSLLTSLYHWQQIQAPSRRSMTTSFLKNLISFSYTAIYPFYNHVDEILKCVRQMKNLRRFFTKLCPEPESNVLQNELERNGASAGRTEGRIDVNDPWNEFETSYTLIPHTIIYLTTDGSLEEYETDDVKMVGIRDTLIEGIDRRLEELGCWSHIRGGFWKRNMRIKVWLSNETSQIGVNG